MNKFHYDTDRNPGLALRVEQVKAAYKETEQYNAERAGTGRGITGSVALNQQRTTAERALERQIRYGRGQYPVR